MIDLAIVGATATGKTALAHELWRQVAGLELVSVDAMAVYRGLDIGTEKPVASPAPWHLLDVAEPDDDFSVARFQSAARSALAGIHSRGHLAVLVGGTGLYHRAVIDDLELPGRYPDTAAALATEAADPSGLAALYSQLGALDPLAASRIEPGNVRRIVRALEVTVGSGRPFSSFGPGLAKYPAASVRLAGLALDRAEIDRRLEERLEGELRAGFLEEVEALFLRPRGLSRTARQAIGYRELLEVAEGRASLGDARAQILRRLKSFARRQEAWFRRDPRVTWFPAGDSDLAGLVLEYWRAPDAPVCDRAAGADAAPSWETA
ncbi:MAG: tRNA (adenosine(37)-N6)-dimethylallyltransferase MiaA [Acidimicrobiales bacterium]